MVLEDGRGSHDAAEFNSVHGTFRHSMDDYYQNDMGGDPLESPPSYEALITPPSFRQRFNIQPREDEGHETLPAYSSYISLEGIFEKKMELEGAVNRAQDRNWYKVWVTLQGTALHLHNCKSGGLFNRSQGAGRKHNVDFPAGLKQATFLRSYNLQHADVGIAADYVK